MTPTTRGTSSPRGGNANVSPAAIVIAIQSGNRDTRYGSGTDEPANGSPVGAVLQRGRPRTGEKAVVPQVDPSAVVPADRPAGDSWRNHGQSPADSVTASPATSPRGPESTVRTYPALIPRATERLSPPGNNAGHRATVASGLIAMMFLGHLGLGLTLGLIGGE